MVTLIFSDMHKKNPLSTIEELAQEMPVEKLVFLGDVDSADIFREIVEFNLPGTKKVILAGNHDYPFMIESQETGNARLPPCLEEDFEEKEYGEEVEKWRKDQLLKEFAKRYLNRENMFMHIENSQRGEIVYCHASLYDSKTNEKVDATTKYLPYQVRESFFSHEDGVKREKDMMIRNNFLVMKQKGYFIFFRAHDHNQRGWSICKNENPLTAGMHFHGNPTLREYELLLEPERRYIVSVGAFTRDSYAIFDEKKFKVTLVDRGIRFGGI